MKRRFFAPEVVQASAMDCGPAALKCLLEGFGVSAGFGRLREACQTDVDGTSIDTLEEIAVQLGLDAEQVMVPLDHLLIDESEALPAIIVLQLPNGLTHFVVAWRRHGGIVQVMDPGCGRRWTAARRFLAEVYQHSTVVPAAAWREWAGSGAFVKPLAVRLREIGMSRRGAGELIASAAADATWRSLGALDACARMTASLVRSGGLRRGREASGVLGRFYDTARADASPAVTDSVPAEYWSVLGAEPDEDGEEQLRFRGAVLVRVKGIAAREAAANAPAPLPPELVAALEEPPARPGRELLRLLRADGVLRPAALAAALLIATGGVLLEAILFRGIFDLPRELGLTGQRIAAVAALLTFLCALLLLELPLASGLLRMGRFLELRLRMAFLHKIPRLGDRYFQSRLTSDMAERSHSIHQVRHLPDLGGQLTRAVFELLLTAGGVAWLDPASAGWAVLSAAFALGIALAAQPALMERDLRVRSHLGALSRFYLDALLGLVAIRAHGAEKAVRTEHESLLVEWARAGFGLQRVAVTVDALQFLSGFGLAAFILMSYLARHTEPAGALLLVYWALNLPVLGQEVALIAWQYPAYRNLSLRLLEPLGAPDQDGRQAPVRQAASGPVAIAFENVTVRAGGHTILESVNCEIPAGSHVAIVGASGAGKSTLAGLLLGWHTPVEGSVRIDGTGLDGARLNALRAETAWVDPAVQLWNRSFADNLSYGAPGPAQAAIGMAIDGADLREVLEHLPDGMQTALGEGGAMVSGGEGQRVRFGRAMVRSGARLVILDEPFRGLGREQRRELLARARRFWSDATLICITHDVAETRGFARVLVIEGGRLVEDGSPAELAAHPGTRYRSMLDADRKIREVFWSDAGWRKVRLEGGELTEAERRKEPSWLAR